MFIYVQINNIGDFFSLYWRTLFSILEHKYLRQLTLSLSPFLDDLSKS